MNPLKVGFSAVTTPPLGRVDLVVRTARLLRFDSLWTIDHFESFFHRALWDKDFAWIASSGQSPHEIFEYQTLLGYLARRAGRLQLGVGVTEPVRRHPVLLAQSFLTLSHMVKRPPILGIGSGEAENIIPYGLDFSRPVSRLEEALQVIRLCLQSDGPINFQGNFFQLDHALMDIQPAPGRTPELWVAAHRPRMLALTGRYGDGWFPAVPMTPQDYGDRLALIQEAASEEGRDPAAITPGFSARMVIGRTEAEAREFLHHKAVRYLAFLIPDYVWQEHGVQHPMGEGHGGLVDFTPERYTKPELEEMIAKVPVDLLARSAVWGTPKQVLERLREFAEAGMRHVVLQPVSGLISRRAALSGLRAVVWLARKLRS